MTVSAPHPLEPLTAAEIAAAVSLLRGAGKLPPTTRIVHITLVEPPKELFYTDEALDPPPPRKAQAVLFDNGSNACFEATLALSGDPRLLTWTHIPDVQPTMTMDEQKECEKAVLDSPLFRQKLEARCGVVDMALVMIDIWTVGYYGPGSDAADRGRRLARPLIFLRADPTDNGYAKPVEGLQPVVDLNAMAVIRVEDFGSWPLPPQQGHYAADRVPRLRTDVKPLEIVQREGPSFAVKGHEVSWQKWSFVVGFTGREGLVLHHLRYDDNGRVRPILFRASVAEMVVPYGDPAPQQARKNAFDVGEYGLGYSTNSLTLGCDCLGTIHYFDAHLCTSRGAPFVIRNAVCLHEEDHGILWKHTDRRLDHAEVRRSRRLVVSSIATVENYEYGYYWYLYQDGSIQFEVKLTGILSLGALHPGETSPYGALVAPQLFAPVHQHFFNVRLDFALDGPSNSAYQVDVVPQPPGPDNPYGNAFGAEARLLATELQARGTLKWESARTWKVVNPTVRNALGDPVAYKLLPGDNAPPFASPTAWWRKRAGFVDYQVWVTPYSESERFPAGDYPNQHHGGDGLTRWTAADRPVSNRDIVLWYTFGHTHVPRPEDWPVMPAVAVGFWLKPAGFFDQNPSNDVPPSPAAHPACAEKCGASV